MATSATKRGAAGDTTAKGTDKAPATKSNIAEVNVSNLFQWKRPRASWRHALAAGATTNKPGGPSSGSGSGAGVAGTGTVIIDSTGSGGVVHTNSSAAGATVPGLPLGGTAASERTLHSIQSPGRITKIRHRPSPAAGAFSSSSTSAAAAAAATLKSLASASTSNNSSTFTVSAAISTTTTTTDDSSTAPSRKRIRTRATTAASSTASAEDAAAAATKTTTTATVSTFDLIEMENPVLSFWGPDLVPLPSRFARIKRNLIAGHEAALEHSWARLISALRDEVEHIEGLGSHLIPSIEFSDLDEPSQTSRFGRDLKRYGVGVVRGVVPRQDADAAVRDTVRYIRDNHDSKPPPLPQDPTCFDFFWTPAQVCTRAHPSVLRAQRFMMGLWGTAPEDRLVTRYPIAYGDRIRIHTATMAAGTPNATPIDGDFKSPNGLPGPSVQPKSADDWLSAIQSSGIIAQVDNGSLERWEPDGYQRGGTYDDVFRGNWEGYDPWECAGRATTSTDLYNGYGACSIFRMFQGLVALSTIEPGMIRLLPSPRLVTAYFLLRPFFSPRNPPPEIREGPEWDAFLAPSNWSLDREQNSYVHGAVPGHAQRVTELWHPHLQLRRSMITLPTLQSGDYILWHPDLAYHITSNGAGLRSPIYNRGDDEVSMLVYVPAAPLTQTNALYLARQRKAFLRGQPGPDFDSTGSGLESEAPQSKRLGEKDIEAFGGEAGLQAMGLAMYESADKTPPPEDKDKRKAAGKGGDVDMDGADAETKSVSSNSSMSHAESEVIRLANIILFPDKAMMGFP